MVRSYCTKFWRTSCDYEYNPIICDDPRITTYTVEEFVKAPQKFHSIISISSIEHDGLGRYGDPIRPDGDLLAMKKIRKMLYDDGLLYLAVPVSAKDQLVWNAGRLYGPKRFPLLLEGFEIIAIYGDGDCSKLEDISCYWGNQPVFVLRPKQ